MKKLLVILSLAMAAFSFQASAAGLSWITTPATAIITDNGPQILNGDRLGIAKGTVVNDHWAFHLDNAGQILLGVTAQPEGWLTSVLFSGGALDFVNNLINDTWSFHGILAAGDYTIDLSGISPRGGKYNIQVQTPIPAALWLFGSALLGLTGISRRKSVTA
jgi:hypothetical protein